MSAEREDAWSSGHPAGSSETRGRAARARQDRGWVTTRDGWISAESIGSELRERFASEDLSRGRRSTYLRVGLLVAAVLAVGAAIAILTL